MATPMKAAIHQLLCPARRADEAATDRELLRRFAAARDQEAFAALVRRHAALVLGVCRRCLPTVQDAEDACQAVFLVLARKAATGRWQPSIANWLYTTARKVAHNARVAAQRRVQREARAARPAPAAGLDRCSGRELLAALDEELARLTAIYREALVLCYLEGLTCDQTAARLGVPSATVKTRLERGRKRLGDALTRRGVVGGAGLLALAATSPAGASSPRLIQTILAAATGKASPAAAALARGVMVYRRMTTALLGLAFLLGAAFWSLGGASSGPQPAAQPTATAPRKSAEPAAVTSAEAVVAGTVLGPEGHPVGGADLVVLRPSGAQERIGRTALDGTFRVRIPAPTPGTALLARTAERGLDFQVLAETAAVGVTLRLAADHPITGRVLDTEGKPVIGAEVVVPHVRTFAAGTAEAFLELWKTSPYLRDGAWQRDKELWISGEDLAPREDALLAARTDRDGRFTLRGLGAERVAHLRVGGAGVAEMEIVVLNRAGFDPEPFNRAADALYPKGPGGPPRWLLAGPSPVLVAEAEKPITGVVRDEATGKPVAGAVVRLIGDRQSPTRQRLAARTDADGRYRLRGARKNAQGYSLAVWDDPQAGYLTSERLLEDSPGFTPVVADLQVCRGTIITGRVLDGATGQPIPGLAEVAILAENPFAKAHPRLPYTGWTYLDAAAGGTFRIVAPPGPVLLMGGPDTRFLPDGHLGRLKYKPAVADPQYPQYFSAQPFGYFGARGQLEALQGNYCKVLDIPAGATPITQDIVLERATDLPLTLADPEGRAVPGAWVGGLGPGENEPPLKLAAGKAAVYHLEGKPREVAALEPTRGLAGILTLKGDEKEPVLLRLAPTGAVVGRVVGEDGRPLGNLEVLLNYRRRSATNVYFAARGDRFPKTDADGRFRVDGLFPGVEALLGFGHPERRVYVAAGKPVTLTATPGGTTDVGEVRVKRWPGPGEK